MSAPSSDAPRGRNAGSLRGGAGRMHRNGPGATSVGEQPSEAKRAVERQLAKRQRIVGTAMAHFADHGYEGARVEDIAAASGVSKGAVFGYFESKAGLFLAAYQAATRSFHAYLDAPPEMLEQGFFSTVMYWLERTPLLVQESWIPYRVSLLGNYCSDLRLRREITQYLLREDPYGTRAFVEFGIARGEVRQDIDARMIVSLFDWLMDRCQDAVIAEELDPGLFGMNTPSAAERHERFVQFVELMRSAMGPPRRP
jgi:AcrR family transcriptional regulator